jgi:hypothetical protein
MSQTHVNISSYTVGSISVDENGVRGEGPTLNPHLKIPIKVELTARPTIQQLAIANLWCTLNLGDPHQAATQVGPPIPVFSNSAFLAASPAEGKSASPYDLRFPVPLAALHFIEVRRHASQNHDFVANLVFNATIIWVSGVGNSISSLQGTEPRAIPDNPFAATPSMGMLFTVAPFDLGGTEPLQVRVSASQWVADVLPGLGYDRVRMIEFTLPKATGAVSETVIKYLDDAFVHYDAARYRDAISRCRDARNALEAHLGASSSHPIADVVMERLGLSNEDPRRAYIFDAWSTYSKLTNAGPHYQRADGLTRHDALLCLNATPMFVEYLGGLLA